MAIWIWIWINTCLDLGNEYNDQGGGGSGVIRSTYGAVRMRARKDAVVSAETTGSGSRFHSGIVRGKYEFGYCSQWVVRWRNLWGWLLLVCLLALVRWSAALIATSPFTILNIMQRRCSLLLRSTGGHFRSWSMVVTMALGWCLLVTKHAAFLCMRSMVLTSLV